MRAVKVFIDSNTFIYSLDEADGPKRDAARNWLTALAFVDAGATNLQVLNEVTSVLTRRATRFPKIDIFATIDGFAEFGIAPIAFSTTLAARTIHHATRYSWWDSLLLASALELGCTHFLSEDLGDGRQVEGLTIRDPFAHSPAHILPFP